MSEFFFVLKTMVFAVLIVICLQIKVRGETIETHSLGFMRQSAAIQALRGVAGGAVVAGESAYEWLAHQYHRKFGSEHSRSSSLRPSHDHRAKRERAWNNEVEKSEGDDVD